MKDLVKEYIGKFVFKDVINNDEIIIFKLIFELGVEDDVLVNEIIDKIFFYLVLVFSYIGNMLNLEKIIIGGGVLVVGD